MSDEIEVHLYNMTCPRCGKTLEVTDGDLHMVMAGRTVRKTCQCGLTATLAEQMEPNA